MKKVLTVAVFLATCAGAQTKISGAGKCGKPEQQQSIEVGDRPGHVLAIVKQACTWTMPIDMARNAGSLHLLRGLEYGGVRTHGAAAKRRVLHFWSYTYDSARIGPGAGNPRVLSARSRAVGSVRIEAPEDLAETLVTEYPAGAGIGWHRDAPAFGIVAAVSLGSGCRMRFRGGRLGA